MNKQLKIICILFLALMLFSFNVPKSKQEIIKFTTTKTFSSLVYDGHIYTRNPDVWDAAHDTLFGNVCDYKAIQIGWLYDSADNEYVIYRGFLFFDTSDIPDNANITQVILSIKYISYYGSDNINLTIQHGTDEAPHMPLISTDYYYGHYSGNFGSINMSGLATGKYYNITLNNSAFNWINVTGITKFCIRGSNDIDDIAPGQSTVANFYSAEDGVEESPKLYVTYEYWGWRYIIHGPYYEDGSVANCIVEVELFSKTGDKITKILNGTDGTADSITIDTPDQGWFFRWNASASNYRTYYLSDLWYDEIWIYVADPDLLYLVYTIEIKDLAGVLKTYPYIMIQRYIDDSMKTVQKQLIDETYRTQVYLEAFSSYTIVLSDTNQTYTYGDVFFGDQTSMTLTIKGVDFPISIKTTWKYLRIYAYRQFATPYGNITINYQDTLGKTDSVKVDIKLRNGTIVYSTTLTGNTISLTWSQAENDTDYRVTLTIDHQEFGTLEWNQYLIREGGSLIPWSLNWLGTMDLDTSVIIPALIIIFVGAAFTVINAHLGAIAMASTAAILTYIGWIPISATAIVVAFTIAILTAIVYAKRRMYLG